MRFLYQLAQKEKSHPSQSLAVVLGTCRFTENYELSSFHQTLVQNIRTDFQLFTFVEQTWLFYEGDSLNVITQMKTKNFVLEIRFIQRKKVQTFREVFFQNFPITLTDGRLFRRVSMRPKIKV